MADSSPVMLEDGESGFELCGGSYGDMVRSILHEIVLTSPVSHTTPGAVLLVELAWPRDKVYRFSRVAMSDNWKPLSQLHEAVKLHQQPQNGIKVFK